MEKGYNLGELISVLKRDITELINVRLQLLKLDAVERGSKGISFLIYGLILLILINGALLFGFIALGFLFSEWVYSYAGGFALVVALYLILFLILFLCRKPILHWLTGLFIKEMDPDLVSEGQKEHEVRFSQKGGCYEQR